MGEQARLASALERLAAGAPQASLEVLGPPRDDASARELELRGLGHFLLERYADAAVFYRRASELEPADDALREMFQLAEQNATAAVQVPVPPVRYLERGPALSVAPLPADWLPPDPSPGPPATWLERACLRAGHLAGFALSALLGTATRVYGSLAGYRDEVWTSWDRRSSVLGVLTLAYMRERLMRDNLHDTYPDGARTALPGEPPPPPPGVRHYRTPDGSWNNLDNPREGAGATRFLRNVPPSRLRPESEGAILSPNPRRISRLLLTREGPMKEVPFLNLLAASWIQFENHDWISHGENRTDATFRVALDPDDPLRRRLHQDGFEVGRTQADPTREAFAETTPLTFLNEVTHWWDASQVYGSDFETADRLRSGVDGKLRLQDDGRLPLAAEGVEDTGFVRNWWVGLSMLHTLFAKEHNAICDHLKVFHPHWDDRRLFQVARLINAAVIAKIHTVEWTPAILPNSMLSTGLNANWYGIATNLFKRGRHRKTLAAINIRNPELGGVVGNPRERHGSPFGLTEEFVEVYRLHSLLPEELRLRRLDRDGSPESVPLPATRQAGSPQLTSRFSMTDLFHSFGTQHPGQLVLHNYPRFMQQLSVPGRPVLDLGAVDILRARERGVPRYNAFRVHLGLSPVPSLQELTGDAREAARLAEVYDDIESVDLLVGTLAEGHRPRGFGFGETLFQIFILNATRRLQADRFFTDEYNERTYTLEGLQWIDNADLKSVLLRHHPELGRTGLANVRNAFEPWDAEKRLDPARHPLREWDRELEPDPWRGDAFR